VTGLTERLKEINNYKLKMKSVHFHFFMPICKAAALCDVVEGTTKKIAPEKPN